MKKMKKISALLLAAALLLSLCACGPAEQGSEPTTPPATTTRPAPVTDTVIVTQAEQYTVEQGKTLDMGVKLQTSAVGLTMSLRSEDESIATVTKYGKVTGVAPGSTDIVITSSNGVEKTVHVTVEGYEKVLKLALNVMFNDIALGCYNNETGPVLSVTGDGTYTLQFDCATLSEQTRALGVTGLNNLTSVYIKDYGVTTGDLRKSHVTDCEIRWDSVTVDGVELTITNGEFKSALKDTGIFDTNDPVNAWDGSAVAEVTVDTENHVLNFLTENPQVITVTFTLSGLTFE